MKKLTLTCLFLLSVFFSKSYGMNSFEPMMLDLRQMMLKRNVFVHIVFGYISRYVIQSADSIRLEKFPDEETKEEMYRTFDEYEKILQDGTLLSVITVEEFDELFIDKESLESFIRDEREKEINKICCNEEIDCIYKVEMIVEFKRRFDPLVIVIEEKLGFLRQIVVEKQGLEIDISVLEKESEVLDDFIKKIVRNRSFCLEIFSSDESGECVIS